MTPDLLERATGWRHDLHGRPETGFAEHRTADYVAAVLEGLGLEVHRGIGGTGMVASIVRGSGARAVGLRADMDALPIDERTGAAWASQHAGTMHACGHDGHMAMLLAAAALLVDEGGFDGTVHLVLQPAEEHGLGARAMLDDGLLERFPMEAMYGLHNLPGLPAGRFATRPGPIMASEDTFEIRIHGRGGHAARPQMVVDPIVVGAEVVLALQTIVSRTIDPSRSAVVSCTGFETDGARNAIPGEVVITGDTRSFEPDVQAAIERRMREVCAGVAAAHGATADVVYRHEFAPTVNDERCTQAAVDAATAALGADRVDPQCAVFLGSEDFGVFARAVPACFSFLGNGTEPGEGGTPLHSRDYDFNDALIDAGASYYVELVRAELPLTGRGVAAAGTPARTEGGAA